MGFYLPNNNNNGVHLSSKEKKKANDEQCMFYVWQRAQFTNFLNLASIPHHIQWWVSMIAPCESNGEAEYLFLYVLFSFFIVLLVNIYKKRIF